MTTVNNSDHPQSHSLSPAEYEMIASAGPVRVPEPSRNAFDMWARPFTMMYKIPVFKRVWIYLFFLAAYTLAIDLVAFPNLPTKLFKEASTAGTYGSVVIGLLLVFRTNSAYERWWEGRKLWGQLTNDSRNLAMKVSSMVAISEMEKRQFGELIISFAYSLKHHLRDTVPNEPLPGVNGLSGSDMEHLPLSIANRIYKTVSAWQSKGLIDGLTFIVLDNHTRALMDICGACERIKASPIALSYRAFMRQGIALNLLTWPWYLTQEYDVWFTLPPLLVGAYFLIGIELIAEDVEEPFGHDGDDLPLDNICSSIRNTVSKILPVPRAQRFTTTISKPRVDLLNS